ncbi:TPA: hypothetical protein QDB15_001150 [Burkholderia vietnamiensis]|nr:hypothetical protein [Burkholderia vietnamiensis]KVS03163.1 hypothetical protein WK32_16580 [Burkholderia vietnamiensis]MBR8082991.1 hypothetical protein [Burkholderia vietnamiensis]MCA8210375.1 hypothetical protein [Burkholderia vietnamiensis]HDR9100012.1 hypothetical protein [Burkholderia vietnamiensis]HDR9117403.1 hypothetical protein [Burkholderia vietnamiensis]
MADASIPVQHSLFVARADWRDESQYPRADLLDPSIWSWEFLRRSDEYAQEFDLLRPLYADVPATPFPMDSLLPYITDPAPEKQDVNYKAYSQRHPRHFAYPIKDYVRKEWGINVLANPNNGFAKLVDRSRIYDKNNKLAWLFACNTVEVLNSPTTLLVNEHGLSKTSGWTSPNEVLLRMSLTGNLDEQIESLRRQISTFFEGGNRNGALLVTEHIDLSNSPSAQYSHELGKAIDIRDIPSSQAPGIAVSNNMWKWAPVRLKSLHYVLRMADAIASLEQGTFARQLESGGVGSADALYIARLISDSPDCSYDDLYEPMSRALAQYFYLNPLTDDARDADAKTVLRWLEMAHTLVIERNYLSVARTNARTSNA